MTRVQKILENEFYIDCCKKIAKWEETREFCGHDMVHFLDVARIAMLLNLEENETPISQDIIYGTALLHDMGRYVEYEEGTDHALASANLAPDVLRACEYSSEEIALMVEAIANHRNPEIKDGSDLKGLLYRADKLSRPCYGCLKELECNWSKKKKNMVLHL